MLSIAVDADNTRAAVVSSYNDGDEYFYSLGIVQWTETEDMDYSPTVFYFSKEYDRLSYGKFEHLAIWAESYLYMTVNEPGSVTVMELVLTIDAANQVTSAREAEFSTVGDGSVFYGSPTRKYFQKQGIQSDHVIQLATFTLAKGE